MEIESKIDEDRIEIIRKEPEVGDLVAYNRLWDAEQYTKELGIVPALKSGPNRSVGAPRSLVQNFFSAKPRYFTLLGYLNA